MALLDELDFLYSSLINANNFYELRELMQIRVRNVTENRKGNVDVLRHTSSSLSESKAQHPMMISSVSNHDGEHKSMEYEDDIKSIDHHHEEANDSKSSSVISENSSSSYENENNNSSKKRSYDDCSIMSSPPTIESSPDQPAHKKSFIPQNKLNNSVTSSSKKRKIDFLVKSVYYMGDYVMTQDSLSKNKSWWAGIISGRNQPDGTYRVNYNSGSRLDDVPLDLIRCLTNKEVKRLKKLDKDKRAKTSYEIKTGKFLNAGLRVRVEGELGIISVNTTNDDVDGGDAYIYCYDVNLDDGSRVDNIPVKFLSVEELYDTRIPMLPEVKSSDLIQEVC